MAKPTEEFRLLLLSLRQARLIELGAIEDYLGLDRSVIPKHKRKDESDTGKKSVQKR